LAVFGNAQKFEGADESEGAIIAGQFYGTRRAASPEVLLLLAILKTAIDDLRDSNKRLRADALNWFNSQDTKWPFSFCNVCAFLGFDPDFLRREVMNKRTHKRANRIL